MAHKTTSCLGSNFVQLLWCVHGFAHEMTLLIAWVKQKSSMHMGVSALYVAPIAAHSATCI